MNIKEIWTMLRETFQDWSEDKAPRLAAALSYYTVFSLAPLLVLVIAIAGFIIGSDTTIRTQLIDQIRGLMGEQGAAAVEGLISSTSQPSSGIIATVISIITLLLGATGVFGQLQDALNTIWEVEPKKGGGIMGMIKDRFLSFTMVLGVAFLLLVSLVISTFLSIVNTYFTNLVGGAGIIAQIINIVFSIGIITLIFAMIFKILPDAKVKWRDVWIGALATAILFTIGRTLLGVYLSRGATTSAFGAAGSLVILLLWVYYSAQILFFGAEFTQVYARHTRSAIEPADNARRITEEERVQQGVTPRKEARQQPQAQPGMAPLPSTSGISSIQRDMLPVTGQPEIHLNVEDGSHIRYEPSNPNTVIPVIAAGVLASVFTLSRVVRKVADWVIDR